MTVFLDDFERADGALGGNWTVVQSAATIVGGTVQGTSHWTAYDSTCATNGRHSATVHFLWGSTNSFYVGPVVKCTSTPAEGFRLSFASTTNPPTVHIRANTNFNGASLASYTLPANIGPYVELKLVWDAGHLSGYVNGVLSVETDSSLYSNGQYPGMCGYSTAATILDFRAVSGGDPTLSASPMVVGNYGACTTIDLTGTNTNWTPGTPGSPTFTVDHGSIAQQEVLTATTAQISYCPGSYLGTTTITDASTGATVGIVVTSDPNTVPPGAAYQFTPQAVAMVNNTAGESYLELLTKPNTPVAVDAFSEIELVTLLGRVGLTTGAKVTPVGVPDAGLLDLLWQLVNASQEAATGPWEHASGVPLSEQLGDLIERWNTLITGNNYTLGTVITTLAGEGVPTHKDIIDGLSSVQFDDSAIIAAIEAARGEDLPSIRTAVDLIGDIATIAGYDLSDVLTAIEAVRGSGLPTIKSVMDKLLLIQPGNTPDLAMIDSHIVQQTTLQAIMDLAVGSLRGGNAGATITGVLDAIDDLSSNLPTAGGAPTLWPGVDNVDLGTEVAITDGMVVEGPMHGLLMTVTAQPVRYQVYQFGDVNSWARVGAVIFGTDRDDYERSQTFGLDRQILNPQTMEVAESAIIRINEGWEGTVRTWKRST